MLKHKSRVRNTTGGNYINLPKQMDHCFPTESQQLEGERIGTDRFQKINLPFTFLLSLVIYLIGPRKHFTCTRILDITRQTRLNFQKPTYYFRIFRLPHLPRTVHCSTSVTTNPLAVHPRLSSSRAHARPEDKSPKERRGKSLYRT